MTSWNTDDGQIGSPRSFSSDDSNSESEPIQAGNQLEGLETFDVHDPIGKTLFDDYAIREIIGEGGMAVVYKARKKSTGGVVAAKTLKIIDPAVMKRFQREIEIHLKLKHPNIVDPVDFAMTATGQAFFFMEYLEGLSLEDIFESRGRVERLQDIYQILLQICDALEHAHAAGIVHRDVKPGNVVINESDGRITVKVVDFGLAKLHEDLQKITKTGQVLGSPVYMSPEQCMGLDLDPRSDVYSLGIVAYEMVTGVVPYGGTTPVALMEQHCNPSQIPKPIGVHRADFPGEEEFNMIVLRALESEPDERFQTAAEMKEAFIAWGRLVNQGDDGGHFSNPAYKSYDERRELGDALLKKEASKERSSLREDQKFSVDIPAVGSAKPQAVRLPGQYTDDNGPENKIQEQKPEPQKLEEVPLESGKLRDLVAQSQQSEIQKRHDDLYGNFASEDEPAEAKIGNFVIKMVLFLFVSLAVCGGTLYLILNAR